MTVEPSDRIDLTEDGECSQCHGLGHLTIPPCKGCGSHANALSKRTIMDSPIDIVARQLLANAAREIEWESIPDIGEYDWLEIEERLLVLAPEPEGFDDAITLLEDTAAKWAKENDDERSNSDEHI